jgi:DNA-directed RNA polymerase specialized sigma24 family protein
MTLNPLTDCRQAHRQAGRGSGRISDDAEPFNRLQEALASCLEDLTFPEVAAILGIGEGAAKMRRLRALQPIPVLMEERDGPEPGP